MVRIFLRVGLVLLSVLAVGSGVAVAVGRMLPRGGQLMHIMARSLPDTIEENIYLVDMERSLNLPLTFSGYNKNAVWSPDGEYIAFTKLLPFYPQLVIMNVYGKSAIPYTSPYESLESLVWSPDGKRIAFTASIDDLYMIGVLDIAKRATTLINVEGSIKGLTWSPDGRWLVYPDDFGASPHLAVMACPPENCSGDVYPILEPIMVLDVPRWSTDGRQLAVVRVGEGLYRLYHIQVVCDDLLNPDCFQNPTLLFETPYNNFDDVHDQFWSPDTEQVAFVLYDNRQHIQVVDSIYGQRELTDTYSSEIKLAWSPDGTQIAYLTPLGFGGVSINVVNPNTGAIRSVIFGSYYEMSTLVFEWRP